MYTGLTLKHLKFKCQRVHIAYFFGVIILFNNNIIEVTEWRSKVKELNWFKCWGSTFVTSHRPFLITIYSKCESPCALLFLPLILVAFI